jgi:hypothetical protein
MRGVGKLLVRLGVLEGRGLGPYTPMGQPMQCEV